MTLSQLILRSNCGPLQEGHHILPAYDYFGDQNTERKKRQARRFCDSTVRSQYHKHPVRQVKKPGKQGMPPQAVEVQTKTKPHGSRR